MAKVDLGKPNIVLNDKMNKKDLRLDTSRANPLKKNILKQLGNVSQSFEELESIINKMVLKKMFSDEYNNVSIQCARKCLSQSQISKNLMISFDTKYNDDVKTILIKDLDDRISYLESVISSNKE